MWGLVDMRIYLGIIDVAFEVEVAVEKRITVSSCSVYTYGLPNRKKGPKNLFDWNFRPVFVVLQGDHILALPLILLSQFLCKTLQAIIHFNNSIYDILFCFFKHVKYRVFDLTSL